VTLYRRALGERWNELPQAVRAMHDVAESRDVSGHAEVRRGTTLLARLIGAAFGFPPAAPDIPVRVHFDVRGEREVWTRHFGERAFSSEQWQGTGRFAGLFCERFGAFTFGLELEPIDGRLYFNVACASVMGIPLPVWLTPVSITSEFEREGRFHFDVEIRHPLAGLIVGYRGWLINQAPNATSHAANKASSTTSETC
jgi:uncharacterized protein DUF4166